MRKIFYFTAACLLSISSIYAHSYNIHTAIDNSTGLNLFAWEHSTGLDVEIHSSTRDNAGVYSSIYTLSDPSVCINCRNAKLAINAAGDSVVVWIALDPFLFVERIYGSMFVGVSWIAPQPLSLATESILNDNYSVRLSDSGQVTVSWSSFFLGNLCSRSLFSPTYGTWGTTIDTIES